MAAIPDSFFQPDTFGTLFGCVAVTTVVAGVVQQKFKSPASWTGLVTSFLVVIASLFLADRLTDPKSLVVGFFNAFLVFTSAAGATSGLARSERGEVTASERPLFKRYF